ncbi:hypothetical protein BJ978_000466 [Agromyces terreus]|uniref:Transglutaminase-like domain-containing protein n=1 Tax=Agromyces terreus TaxID=424795 RepID=A0A9X2KB49_9MICO|nr:DUF2510 domain-containing protein [Agromyces terreus]MCP2369790.1 hypothetical protein [Agromyces terreus]
MPQSSPPAWYPDPAGSGHLRYWDGTQWTEHLAPMPVAALAPAPAPEPEPAPIPAPSAAPSATGRARRGWLIGSIAAATAAALVTATIVVIGIGGAGGSSAAAAENLDDRYDWTEPMLDLEPDHVFEVPAAYDLDEISADYVEPDPESGYIDTSFAVAVYTDPAFTRRAEATIIQYDPGRPIAVLPREMDMTIDDVRYKSEENTGWGLHDEYFLVQRLDDEGAALAKPRVTRFTIANEFEAPIVTFSTDAQTGDLHMAWNEVPGATRYLVYTSSLDTESSLRMETVLATTAETEWTSTDQTLEAIDAPFVLTQNDDMDLFDGSSADTIIAGWGTGGRTEYYDFGVIATDGTRYSPYRDYDAVEIAGALPYEIAFDASRNAKLWGDSGYIDGVENLQTSVYFTSLDGATRSTVATVDLAEVRDYDDRWVLPLMGRGTRIGEWVPLSKSSTPDLPAAIAAFNERAAAEAPTTGGTGFSAVSGSVAEVAAGSKIAPETELPVFGSSEMVTYLAKHLIAQTPVIDVSAYVSLPGAPSLADALFEALLQNPYAMGVESYTFSADGDRVGVQYQLRTAEAQQLQTELAAKVAEVVASVVDEGQTDADKVVALNDWLTENAEYDHRALAARDANGGQIAPNDRYAWRADGVLLQGLGVCASYADAFHALAGEAGVESVVVTGDVLEGGRHAWNKVQVDGTWRAVDVTWNDAPEANEFLMITDAEFVDSAARAEDAEWMVDAWLAEYATR